MDWLTSLWSTQTPVLPAPWLAQLHLALGWGLVLAAGGAWLGGRLLPARRAGGAGLALLALLWCLWPGPAAPTYWLGLAFRAPSLTTVILCGGWLWHQLGRRRSEPQLAGAAWLMRGGVVLGWLLLLDTFAVWPMALYALGFSAWLLPVVVLVAGLPWLLHGARAAWLARGAVGVLLLFVLLRLPSGNLWDALLDPWLWAGLHLVLVRRLWLRVRSAPAATRA